MVKSCLVASLYIVRTVSRGGGVLIAVKNYLSSSCLPSPVDLEVISVKFLRSDHFMISFELLLPSIPSHSRQLPFELLLPSIPSHSRQPW